MSHPPLRSDVHPTLSSCSCGRLALLSPNLFGPYQQLCFMIEIQESFLKGLALKT